MIDPKSYTEEEKVAIKEALKVVAAILLIVAVEADDRINLGAVALRAALFSYEEVARGKTWDQLRGAIAEMVVYEYRKEQKES